MPEQREYLVHGEIPARVHKNVSASSEAAARRKAASDKDGWFYDDDSDAPIRIVAIEVVDTPENR